MKRFVKPSLLAASVLVGSTAFAATQAPAANSSQQPVRSISTSPSPLLGWNTAFNGSDTFAYQRFYDFNLYVLQQHSAVAAKNDLQRPLVNLSGEVGVDGAVFQNGSQSAYNRTFTLGTATMDAIVDASQWISAAISLGVDGQNSKNQFGFTVQQAFLTVGNLNQNPFFVTAGDFYAPFGAYINYYVGKPLTARLGQTLANSVDLGFTKGDWTFQAFGMNGQVKSAASDANTLFDGGFDARMQHTFGNNLLALGAGYISNMAESNSVVAGSVSPSSSTYAVGHRVSGIDANAMFAMQHFTFIGEYVAALEKFASGTGIDVSGGHGSLQGKEPKAADLEAVYNFSAMGTPLYAGVGYGMSKDAEAYVSDQGVMPQYQYTAVAGANIWKNTVLEFEYNYNKNYKTASQKTANVFQTEFDVYF